MRWTKAWISGEGNWLRRYIILNFESQQASRRVNFLTSRRSFEFDEQLVAAIKAFANVEKCTTSMVFLAALNIWLFGETGHTDIRVGLLMANRGNLQTAGTMGHFMNTVDNTNAAIAGYDVPSTSLSGTTSVLAAHAHQQLPFEYLANVFRRARPH